MGFSARTSIRRKVIALTILSSVGFAVAAAAQGVSLGSDDISSNDAAFISDVNTGTGPIWDRLPADMTDFYRVPGQRTPSGFDVPRFVSLKFGRVNARTGPSMDHSIAYQYQRRDLPVIVVAETEMWRKVRDIHGDEAWVRKPALSGELHAVTLNPTYIRKKPSVDSIAVAKVEEGTLIELGDCGERDYCRVRTKNGLKGWAHRSQLWGAQANL